MRYRREIDGLRAIAVAPVILFHAGVESFSGGFIGVDIFFVISGYLITSIVLDDIAANRFSVIQFYERRARRILPALFLIIFATAPFAWMWMLPNDMKDFSQSLIAVPLYVSNFLFTIETGYWGAPNEIKPLLHTWSLAVEEQFYIAFPLLILLIWRINKTWLLRVIVALGFISLATAQWGAEAHPQANFFLLPSRWWELALGAIIGIRLFHTPGTPNPHYSLVFANALSLLGIFLITASIFAFDEKTPYPSFYALAPTVGTGLIILFATPGTICGRLLGSKPFVAVGLISYSAYLWHQPLLALARHYHLMGHPPEILRLCLAFITLPLAYISWRFVEAPFRNKNVVSRRTLLASITTATILSIAFGLTGHFTNGFGSRLAANGQTVLSLQQRLSPNYGLDLLCDDRFTLSERCRTDPEPEIVLWGDSYAQHLAQGLLASDRKIRLIQMTNRACGPILDVAPILTGKKPVSWSRDCLEFNSQVEAWLKSNPTVKTVILSSAFHQYFKAGHRLLYPDGSQKPADYQTALISFRATLERLQAMGLTIRVVSPPPSTQQDQGRCLGKAALRGAPLSACDFSWEDLDPNNKKAFDFMNDLAKDWSVIRLDHIICAHNLCKTSLEDGTFIFMDYGHLSREGSSALGRKGEWRAWGASNTSDHL
ncbi:acyltransferase family protein [Magnetofaba australis]|uniref:Putative acyltransferase 3 n=1 Tax=Magnetofaba australis IT-1 TaxID=1434232 RepID=A0A1Y2K3F3_9PROT|nr:acyltransferase family protein [Magnetofaba australis]OSM02588.1 putative acyltransferase 3 [Magnetofaba australis IT-1]